MVVHSQAGPKRGIRRRAILYQTADVALSAAPIERAWLLEAGKPQTEAASLAGDVAFFPAGSRSVWRVPDHLRKVSTLVRPLPRPAAKLLHMARRVRRLVVR